MPARADGRGVAALPREAGTTSISRPVEQGSISGVRDFKLPGLAALCGLILYGLSRGLGWVLHRRRPALTGSLSPT